MLLQIQQLPEWTEYCEKASADLTPDDENYAINEMTFTSIEEAVGFFLAQPESDSPKGFKTTKNVASQEEFDEESESASTPFIWNLIDS